MKNVITRDEAKFWIGIVAVIFTVVTGFFAQSLYVKVQLAEQSKDIQSVSKEVADIKKIIKDETQTNNTQDINIALLKQSLGLN